MVFRFPGVKVTFFVFLMFFDEIKIYKKISNEEKNKIWADDSFSFADFLKSDVVTNKPF